MRTGVEFRCTGANIIYSPLDRASSTNVTIAFNEKGPAVGCAALELRKPKKGEPEFYVCGLGKKPTWEAVVKCPHLYPIQSR